jgi:hypothetical protein
VIKRELIISKYVHGSTAGGYCSVCQKSFEVSYTESDTPAGVRQKLTTRDDLARHYEIPTARRE